MSFSIVFRKIFSMKYLHFLLVMAAVLGFCSCGGSDDNEEPVGADIKEALTISAEGGDLSASVKIKGDWKSSTLDSWLAVSPASGNGGSVAISVKANDSHNDRSGLVTVRSGQTRQLIDITQAGIPQPIEVSQTVAQEEGSVEVPVQLSGAWTASLKNASWATLLTESGNGGSVKLKVTANKDPYVRIGQLTIKSGLSVQTVELVQNGDEKLMEECPLGNDYKLVWADNFDGDALSNDWTYEVQKDHWVNNELQNYVNKKSPDGQAVTTVKNGILSLHCFKENGKIYSARVYGMKKTGWTYGYVEASIKLPTGKGTWPAFWMMPVNFRSWPADGEIDIMEEVGYHKDYVSSSLHATGHVHSNNTQVTKEVYCKGAEGEFHTYGMEWTADYFQFYVDGKKTLYYKNPGTGKVDWPYDAPFYVILNLAWGGDWGGSQGVDESKLPVTMEVDYVRVFQKK